MGDPGGRFIPQTLRHRADSITSSLSRQFVEAELHADQHQHRRELRPRRPQTQQALAREGGQEIGFERLPEALIDTRLPAEPLPGGGRLHLIAPVEQREEMRTGPVWVDRIEIGQARGGDHPRRPMLRLGRGQQSHQARPGVLRNPLPHLEGSAEQCVEEGRGQGAHGAVDRQTDPSAAFRRFGIVRIPGGGGENAIEDGPEGIVRARSGPRLGRDRQNIGGGPRHIGLVQKLVRQAE
ncbi:hypothetical protein D3C87_1416850 [compost metagenome]